MTLLSTLKSRKALAGMVAVATGTATVAAPVVALPLLPAADGDATGSQAVNGAETGTYESCSALFGLTDKTNANYVTFNVEGTADPLPGIGVGLTPVVTVTPDVGDVVECIPEIGFDDEESWFAYLDGPGGSEEFVEALLPYPGTTGYLVPTDREVAVLSEVTPSAATPPFSLSLRIEADSSVDPDFTVEWAPSQLTFESLDFDEFVETITEELGGPTSPLGARLNELIDSDDVPCPDPPAPIDVDLAAALINLTGVPVSFYNEITTENCIQLDLSFGSRILQLAVGTYGLPVNVTVDGPEPAPEPGPGPTPTPTPTPTPVVPRFTG